MTMGRRVLSMMEHNLHSGATVEVSVFCTVLKNDVPQTLIRLGINLKLQGRAFHH